MPTPNVQNEQVKNVEGRAQDGAAVTVQTVNDQNQRITTTVGRTKVTNDRKN